MRIRRFIVAAVAGLSMLGCAGAARVPRTVDYRPVNVPRAPLPEPEPFDPRAEPEFQTMSRVEGQLKELAQQAAALTEQFQREVVWIECGPGRLTCGLIAQQFLETEFVAEFSQKECNEPFGKTRKALSKKCSKKYFEAFGNAVIGRYVAGDPAAVEQACKAEGLACATMVRYELAWLKSHNDGVIADHQRQRGELQAVRAAALAESAAAQHRLQLKREEAERRHERALAERQEQRRREMEELQRRIAAADAQRQEEEQRAEAGRRAMRALAAGLTTYAGAMSGPAFTPTVATGCSSDYECGSGFGCSKPAGLITGVCRRTVNEFGTPTYGPPDPASVGPGQWQCNPMCPIGFHCDRGQCLR
jgi:hypothetical protein